MKDKKDVMRHKLAAQVMKKSSISTEQWATLTDEEIMKLTQFPSKVRASIIEVRALGASPDQIAEVIATELKTVELQSTESTMLVQDAKEYDPESTITDILSEQAEITATEVDTAVILYTKQELEDAFSTLTEGTNWLILMKKAASSLDKARIDNDLITEVAKDQASKNKSKK